MADKCTCDFPLTDLDQVTTPSGQKILVCSNCGVKVADVEEGEGEVKEVAPLAEPEAGTESKDKTGSKARTRRAPETPPE